MLNDEKWILNNLYDGKKCEDFVYCRTLNSQRLQNSFNMRTLHRINNNDFLEKKSILKIKRDDPVFNVQPTPNAWLLSQHSTLNTAMNFLFRLHIFFRTFLEFIFYDFYRSRNENEGEDVYICVYIVRFLVILLLYSCLHIHIYIHIFMMQCCRTAVFRINEAQSAHANFS